MHYYTMSCLYISRVKRINCWEKSTTSSNSICIIATYTYTIHTCTCNHGMLHVDHAMATSTEKFQPFQLPSLIPMKRPTNDNAH